MANYKETEESFDATTEENQQEEKCLEPGWHILKGEENILKELNKFPLAPIVWNPYTNKEGEVCLLIQVI